MKLDNLIYRNKEWLYDQLITQKKTFQQISDEFGFTVRVLKKWAVEIHRIKQKEFFSNAKLTEKQLSIVYGSLLGDGHISEKGYFIIQHSIKQKDYILWKYDNFSELCNKPPRKTLSGGGYSPNSEFLKFNTRRLNELQKLKQLSKKEIINNFDTLALAIYFLDDASKNPWNWELCFGTLNNEEKECFRQHTLKHFGIFGHYKKDERYILYDRRESAVIDKIIFDNIPNDLPIIESKILAKGVYKNVK